MSNNNQNNNKYSNGMGSEKDLKTQDGKNCKSEKNSQNSQNSQKNQNNQDKKY